MNPVAARVAYGAIFMLLWPGLLAAWAIGLDQAAFVTWPVPLPIWLAVAGLAAGIILMASGMRALWVHGGGLPMNAFPPARLVERSAYRLFTHPIYAGHAIAIFCAAALLGSPAGFWVVAPFAALASVALVLGYEGRAITEKFGPRRRPALLALPPDDGGPAAWATRGAALALAWGPWAIAYALFSQAPAAQGAPELRFWFEFAWPRAAWWIWPYSAAYPFVAFCALALRTNREVRGFVVGIAIASIVGFASMLMLPAKAALLAPDGGGLLVALNRGLDADWLALPSFHVAWTLVATLIYTRRWPRWRFVAWSFAALVAASCIGTGSHALVDLVGGAALAALAVTHQRIAQASVRTAERIANSWTSWRLGPLRVIGHAPWTAAAAVTGMLAASLLAGPGHAPAFAMVGVGGLLGALLFGHLVEGRALSRPFGYFGFLFAGLAVLLALALIAPDRAAVTAAAIAVAAPLAQAIGRGRCLVQGCCHGSAGGGPFAIRVAHPMSRVSCVAHLRDVSVRPTQLISALANLAIAAMLLRLWWAQAPASLICGLYLILTGLARFAEEGLRGEPQTPCIGGLTLYQWLGVAIALVGIAISITPSPTVHAALRLDAAELSVALALGAIATLAMSVDWPDTKLPFSRLSPPSPT